MITRSRHPYRKTVIGVIGVAVLLFPVYWMVLTSLRSEADAAHSPPLLAPTRLRTDAYSAAVFDNPDVTHAIVNSAILVLRPFFLRIPKDLESAAMVDGCRPFGAFLRVVLPVSRPGVITVAVLSFLLAWGEFLFALSVTTSTDVQPLTVALAKFSSSTGTPWNQVMAVATVVAVPIVAVFIGLQRYIVGGLTLGGIKE
jgi:multiple sugar transport system permease protein